MSDGLKIILAVVAAVAGVTLMVFVAIGLFTVVRGVVVHLARFIASEVGDVFRLFGAVLTSFVYAALLLGNVIIGRWSAAGHFGRGVRDEIGGGARALYRIVIGNPARLLFMKGLVEGIEERVPAMVQAAPGTDTPNKRTGQFEGYKIVGSLPTGGSGSKLFIAEPDEIKRAGLERAGHADLSHVVIKSFSLADGSSLPQIVRESRALDAAMKLGLILDHDLTSERFFYVMRYVPGQNLTLVTKQLHASSGGNGLDERRLRLALGFVADLLRTLDRYHRGGLWHKDVKPDNIIVEGESAHLVDFGLVTPLRSAMTLTTHGTEYFRDPEMVRQALKGVKVHDVDGTKFDVFGAGAVLYAILEDAFPAHGVLSPMSKSSPEALKWVVRRAMADYDKRYPSVAVMLADVESVRTAAKPLEMRPVDLPSMRGADVPAIPLEVAAPAAASVAVGSVVGAAGSPAPSSSSGFAQPSSDPAVGVGAAVGGGAGTKPAGKPHIVVENWWTGKSRVEGTSNAEVASASGAFDAMKGAASRWKKAPFGGFAAAGMGGARRTPVPVSERKSAREQVATARARAHAARGRAQARLEERQGVRPDYSNGVKGAVALVVVVFLGAVIGLLTMRFDQAPVAPSAHQTTQDAPSFNDFAAIGQFANQTAFVISDLDTLDAEAAAEAKRGLTLLRTEGLKLVGAPVEAHLGSSDGSHPTASVDEWAATLRLARGQASLDGKDAIDSVRGWLFKNSEHFDMVIWLSKTPGGQGKQGLFHFIAFKDVAKPGSLAFAASRMIDGFVEPGRRAIEFTRASGRDVQRMLDDLAERIASAKAGVESTLIEKSSGTDPPNAENTTGITGEARDYVLRLVRDAGQVLSAVRSTLEGDAPHPEQQPSEEQPKPSSKPRRRRHGSNPGRRQWARFV